MKLSPLFSNKAMNLIKQPFAIVRGAAFLNCQHEEPFVHRMKHPSKKSTSTISAPFLILSTDLKKGFIDHVLLL